MKIQYKLGLLALGAVAMSSCAKHDIINDVAPVGQEVPACYWQLNSTVCKAGESFSFQGKYTTNTAAGYEPDHSEVWYQIVCNEEMSATAKLAGTALNYTQKAAAVDTVRSYQSAATFPHSAAKWDGHEYILDGSVNVSRTLSPVKWADIPQWDQENFDGYYPDGFAEEFLNTVIGYLTNEETANSYYSAMRYIYVNYDFTNEQFAANGFPEVPEGVDKSDLWFSTTEASDDALVRYYYVQVDGGVSKNIEITKDAVQISETGDVTYNGIPAYPVYKAAEWLFCRYDDNAGAIVTTIRSEYLPKFKALLEPITFEEWIYDAANGCYKVEFNRNYSLNAQFRVYDNVGNEGRAYDVLTISIN